MRTEIHAPSSDTFKGADSDPILVKLRKLALNKVRERGDDVVKARKAFTVSVMSDARMMRALCGSFFDAAVTQEDDEGAGHGKSADKATVALLTPSSTHRERASIKPGAKPFKGREHRRAMPTPRQPTEIEREAEREVHKHVARSVFDSFMVFDRRIGDLRFCELAALRSKSRIIANVLNRVITLGIQPDQNARVREVLSETQMQRIVQEVQRDAERGTDA